MRRRWMPHVSGKYDKKSSKVIPMEGRIMKIALTSVSFCMNSVRNYHKFFVVRIFTVLYHVCISIL